MNPKDMTNEELARLIPSLIYTVKHGAVLPTESADILAVIATRLRSMPTGKLKKVGTQDTDED